MGFTAYWFHSYYIHSNDFIWFDTFPWCLTKIIFLMFILRSRLIIISMHNLSKLLIYHCCMSLSPVNGTFVVMTPMINLSILRHSIYGSSALLSVCLYKYVKYQWGYITYMVRMTSSRRWRQHIKFILFGKCRNWVSNLHNRVLNDILIVWDAFVSVSP